MSTLGDVVYCTDCDLARTAGADASSGTALAERPRRMATKRDANGEPLCTACLDARLTKRRAEFMLNQGRAPLPQPPAVQESGTGAQRRKAERPTFIRIVRSSSPAVAAPREPAPRGARAKRTPRSEPKQAPAPAPRLSKARARVAEKRFVMLAGEIGFLRAQELMDGLKTRLRGENRSARR